MRRRKRDLRRMGATVGFLLCGAGLLLAACGGSPQESAALGKEADAEKKPAADKPIVLTDANFDQKTGKGVVLVDFWAAWCPPCRTQGPIVEKIAKRYAGRVTVGKLDVDGNPKTAKRFKIRFIPTLIIFKEGKVHRRLTGLHREDALATELDAALAKD